MEKYGKTNKKPTKTALSAPKRHFFRSDLLFSGRIGGAIGGLFGHSGCCRWTADIKSRHKRISRNAKKWKPRRRDAANKKPPGCYALAVWVWMLIILQSAWKFQLTFQSWDIHSLQAIHFCPQFQEFGFADILLFFPFSGLLSRQSGLFFFLFSEVFYAIIFARSG